MAEKELLVTIRVMVSDLPEGERLDESDDAGIPIDELPDLQDVDAFALADLIAYSLTKDNEELFAGSEMYVKIFAAAVVSAEYV